MKQHQKLIALTSAAAVIGTILMAANVVDSKIRFSLKNEKPADDTVQVILQKYGYSGTTEQDALKALGRPVDPELAELGRNLFFDRVLGLANDNSCAGCHAPQAGLADTQSIAIGVGNNCVVGPGRAGLHNQRKSPTVTNAVLYPVMMWNGRFNATSGDPFDNSQGFLFPAPEGDTKFGSYDHNVQTLMAAQGHMPSTELVEMAGTGGTEGMIFTMSKFGGDFGIIEDGTIRRTDNVTRQQLKQNNLRALSANKALLSGPIPNNCGGFSDPVPEARPPLESPNEPIRTAVVNRLKGHPQYVQMFSRSFPSVAAGKPINFSMIGSALSEFQMTLIMADAPFDRYARGDKTAMTHNEKLGAIIFFGKGKCASCHSVDGKSGELFSDFKMHNIGIPPLYPKLHKAADPGEGNVEFKGPNSDEDLGRAEFTGDKNVADYYMFRTSPLRNVGVQKTFMHNGSYTRLEDAIEHHLDPKKALMNYDPKKAGVRTSLFRVANNRSQIAATIDPLLAQPIVLTKQEKTQLLAFVGNALTDPRAKPAEACKLVPAQLPSGNDLPKFEGC